MSLPATTRQYSAKKHGRVITPSLPPNYYVTLNISPSNKREFEACCTFSGNASSCVRTHNVSAKRAVDELVQAMRARAATRPRPVAGATATAGAAQAGAHAMAALCRRAQAAL